VRVENVTDLPDPAAAKRDDALLHSPVSLHLVLHAGDGEFVSSIDPPSQFRTDADACENIGTWPVLVGDSRHPTTMLAAPIILEDFPQIARESPGDLFDGTEIDGRRETRSSVRRPTHPSTAAADGIARWTPIGITAWNTARSLRPAN
jgi:hypothetical protein